MFLKRKVMVLFSLLLCVCIISVITANKINYSPVSAKILDRPQIILDAGHAGFS